MKTMCLVATVAYLCCGASSTFGQIQILNSEANQQSSRFVSDSSEQAEIQPLPFADGDTPDNPFDFLSSQPTPAEASPDTYLPATPIDAQSPIKLDTDDSSVGEVHADVRGESIGDPSSLPVSRNHGRDIVDTIVDYSVLANVQHASQGPVFWTGAAQTPNPVAEILLRQQCVDGLWDGYQAQRDAECAAMWANIAGHPRCCQGQCGTAGGCPTCPQPAVVNRYRCGTANTACATNCDQGPMSSQQPCTQCAQRAAALPSAPRSLTQPAPFLPVGQDVQRNVASYPATPLR
jgi:hypothetical protein